jgi:integrase
MRKLFRGGLAMRRYYLHQRKGVYYAELVTTEGHKLTARSTGKATEDEALLVVSKWLAEGIPGKGEKSRSVETVIGLAGILKAIRKTDLDGNDAMKIVNALKERGLIDVSIVRAGNGAMVFMEFLEEFWDYTSSPYVREKKAHGHTIGRRHCYEMQSRIHAYYADYFADRPLNSITRQDLKQFALHLTEERKKPEGYKGKFAEKLSPSYINKIMIAGTTALSWAFREGIIPHDVTAGLVRFSGTPEKRGVLTPQEAATIFKSDWKDKRSYAGNLLSLTTGLRAGEVLALRKQDIGDKVLYVRHSWSTMDGLKSPKNGETRKVPLLPEVRDRLMELLGENPHREVADPFIFYGLLPDKPMDQKILIDGLKAVCKAAGIDALTRGIVFHSHRHFYAARLADKMTADQISRITGHKSRAVFDTYADHVIDENIEVMAEATAESFGNILQFRKGA